MTITAKRMFTAICALGMLVTGARALTTTNTLGYKESFENYASAPATGSAATNLAGWYSTDQDLSAVTNMANTWTAGTLPTWGAPNVKALQLNTQGQMLTNAFTGCALAAGTAVYIDTFMKFVASDPAPLACVPGKNEANGYIKLAVFANVNTNLSIYYGVPNPSGVADGIVSNAIATTTNYLDATKWYRLTVKMDRETGVPGDGCEVTMFQVLIDGVPVTNAAAYTDGWVAQFNSHNNFNGVPLTGSWWHVTQDSITSLDGIAFQGTGFIDDLSVGSDSPFATGGNWTVTQSLVGGGASSDPLTTITVSSSLSSTNITYTASGWNLINTITTNGVTVDGVHNQASAIIAANPVSATGIVVNFYLPTYSVTSKLVTNVDGATGSANNGSQTVNRGDTYSVTYTADTWSYISDVNSNGTSLGPRGSSYTLTMGPVLSDMVATGTITRDSYTINNSVGLNLTSDKGASFSVLKGQTPTIHYTADKYYRLATVTSNSVGVSGVAGLQTYTLTLDPVTAGESIGATAALGSGSFTWTLVNSGLRSVGGPASYTDNNVAYGSTVSITITAATYSTISAVTSNGSPSLIGAPQTEPYTLVVGPFDGNMSAGATIDRVARTITQVIGVDGTASPTDTLFTVANGESTQIVYSATSQWYRIGTLMTNGAVIAAANKKAIYTQELVAVQENYSNDVTFTRPSYAVSYIVSNGQAKADDSVLNGASVTNTITGDEFYRFLNAIAGDGTAIGNGATAQVVASVLDAAKTVTVNFYRPTNTLHVVVNGPGTGAGDYPVLNGAFAGSTVTASENYNLVTNYSGAGSVIGLNTASATVTNQLVDGDIWEYFDVGRPWRSISVSAGLHGSADQAGPIKVLNGGDTSVTFTASDWYRVDTLAKGGVDQGPQTAKHATLNFTTVLADSSAAATFALAPSGSVVSLVPTTFLTNFPGNATLTEAWANSNSNKVQNGYMLNVDPTDVAPDLSIVETSLNGTTMKVTVLLKNKGTALAGHSIFGTLRLFASDDLVDFSTEVGAYALPQASFDAEGKCFNTFTITDPTKFYRAEITLP